MKKIICMLLVTATVVTFVACGNDKSEKKENGVDISEEKESQSVYEGLTLKEIEDMGFEINSWITARATDGSECELSVMVNNSDGLNLQFEIKVSEDTFKTFYDLDDNNAQKDFIRENLSDQKILNCIEEYVISSKTQLYNLVDKGVYVRNEELEGKTLGPLMEEGYYYEDYSKDDDDCIVKMSDMKDREYQVILDLSGKDVSTDDIFWNEEEVLKDFNVNECYVLK